MNVERHADHGKPSRMSRSEERLDFVWKRAVLGDERTYGFAVLRRIDPDQEGGFQVALSDLFDFGDGIECG